MERITNAQVNTLNQVMSPDRLARMAEAEAIHGDETYTPLEMMADLRTGIFSEVRRGSAIDIYRRNLQRAYIARMEYLMSEESESNRRGGVDVAQSDIRPMVRAELKTLRTSLRNGVSRTSDRMTRYHLEDAVARIDAILDPNG